VVSVRRLVLIAAGVLASIATVSAPALAQTPAQTVGIRLVDAPTNRSRDPRARQYIVDHVAPGTEITRRVEVTNNTAKIQTVQLYAGAGSVADGTFQFGEGRATNDLTSWTTIDPTAVHPSGGAKSQATVTIAVPRNASPGERYGVVWAELRAAAPTGGGVAVVNRVGVRIYLSVGEGGEPASDFGITTFEARRDANDRPIVAATVHNTGGRALDISGQLSLTNGPGGLSAGPFEAKVGTTLGIGQTEPVLVILDRAVPAGPWKARMVLHSGLTEREATAQITFPAAAASSSGRVTIHARAAQENRLLPVLAAIVLLAGMFSLTQAFRHWRRGTRP
jgi:hypothetical protein